MCAELRRGIWQNVTSALRCLHFGSPAFWRRVRRKPEKGLSCHLPAVLGNGAEPSLGGRLAAAVAGAGLETRAHGFCTDGFVFCPVCR